MLCSLDIFISFLFDLLGDYISFFFKEEFFKAHNAVIATELKLPNKVMIFFSPLYVQILQLFVSHPTQLCRRRIPQKDQVV